MAKLLDQMDNCKSQFLVVAIFEHRFKDLFTDVAYYMLLSIVITLGKDTNDETMGCQDIKDVIMIVR